MFSQTIEYALRAMARLATEPTGCAATKEVAEQAQVPSVYLAKVFQHLQRGGLVHAQRGVGGGIRFAKSPDKFSMLKIIEAVEPLKRRKGRSIASLATLETTMIAAPDLSDREPVKADFVVTVLKTVSLGGVEALLPSALPS